MRADLDRRLARATARRPDARDVEATEAALAAAREGRLEPAADLLARGTLTDPRDFEEKFFDVLDERRGSSTRLLVFHGASSSRSGSSVSCSCCRLPRR